MKIFFIALGLMTIFGTSVMAYYLNTNDRELSELEIANIEALAETENPTVPIPCHSSGQLSATNRYTDCSTCTPVVGHKGTGREGICYPR